MRKDADITVAGRRHRIVDLPAAAEGQLERLPYILRIMLENVLRNAGDDAPRAKAAILNWLAEGRSEDEIPFLPGRVMMHDTTCGPALVDIAGMRASLAEAGYDPRRLNPVLPVDVSTDHSLAVDVFGAPDALRRNMEREFGRNAERYRFMKWATRTLSGVRVHPPGTGIMHTLNLERLASVVTTAERDGASWAMPDTLIGTDSHTPMINGIGVLGWGVGGLEAESVFFGMPVMIRVPDIVGVRLKGRLRQGVLATDLALTVTERLRRIDLADRFVEFYGEGVSTLSAGDRAVIANMTPEFGANSGFFPIDDQTLRICARRVAAPITSVSWRNTQSGRASGSTPRRLRASRTRSRSISIGSRSASQVRAGRRTASLPAERSRRLRRCWPPTLPRHLSSSQATAQWRSLRSRAAPTRPIRGSWSPQACVARKARRFGLTPPAWVKTSLAPGSPTAERYLRRAGLLADLEAVGFGIVGYGCTTCIGNSGPLPAIIEQAMAERGILPVAVLSGNRNFPGRVHPQLEAGFLASPPLVVAFALAGDVNRDILTDPIGRSPSGEDIRLADLWPTGDEIDAALALAIDAGDYETSYAEAEASEAWRVLDAPATRPVPMERELDLHPAPALRGLRQGHAARHLCSASAARARRRHHHRSHLAGRADPAAGRSRRISGGEGREPSRPERLRLPPRQLGGHGPGPVHQQVGAQPARPADRAGLHDSCRLGRASAAVSRSRALRQRGRLGRRGGGRALWHGLVARLGRERRGAARRTRGAGLELRAHPSLQPDRHGHPASASSAGAASERSAPASRRSDPHRCRSRKDRSARPGARHDPARIGGERNLHGHRCHRDRPRGRDPARRRHHSPHPASCRQRGGHKPRDACTRLHRQRWKHPRREASPNIKR